MVVGYELLLPTVCSPLLPPPVPCVKHVAIRQQRRENTKRPQHTILNSRKRLGPTNRPGIVYVAASHDNKSKAETVRIPTAIRPPPSTASTQK